ncbi:TnsD family Tn7-like transposition protein [Vibrio jasicida]|uniref:TnsD family Tn7-like transposition protein n=1 Tax=Vibrio jasicida TaxID=766224 RepID=UPI004068A24E
MEANLIPNHLPDETAYSLLCRLHLRAAHNSFIKDTLSLVNVNASRPANEFPSYIPGLSRLIGLPELVIVNEMTTFQYYKPFCSEEVTNVLLKSLISGHTASLQARLGKIASRLPSKLPLTSCPLCVAYDIETYGTSYWHIIHQVAGLNVCPIHKCYLHKQPHSSMRIVLPTARKPIQFANNTDEVGFSKLIQNELNYYPANISLSTIHNCYLQQLAVQGLLTSHSRIKQRMLRCLLLDNLNSIHIEKKIEAYFTSQINKHQYPECLFYNIQAVHQPLKHLLFISALFNDWAHFLDCLETSQQTLPQKNIAIPTPPVAAAINWELAIAELKSGSSMRAVAKSFGTTVNTLKIKAAQQNIKVDTRPSKLFKDTEEQILNRLDKGDKTQSIAADFGLSVGAIEKVLSKHSELKEVRKKIRFSEARNLRCTEVLDYLVKYPNATRNQIKRELNGAYMWLYRHEREWLYKNLPPEIPRQQRYNRSDHYNLVEQAIKK